MQKATFAAGCFWGVEAAFRQVDGIVETTVGYTGGQLQQPSYEQVCSGTTGHAEAVDVEFDPAKVSYEQLLDVFWQCHNPTQFNRQGPDVGTQYRSAVFYHNSEQQTVADESKRKLEQSGQYNQPIVTEITAASAYFPAEEYHQQYLEKRGQSSCRL